jgi:nitrilase
MYPADLPGIDELSSLPDTLCRGGSAIIGPLGDVLAGPVYDQETILYANIDLAEVVQARLDFDAVGHYARSDVFQFAVDESPRTGVRFERAAPSHG